ncbi:hypothetical protein LTR10_000441 [Elasticomyces elasticus]|nr:hypothetical protein LTR10_000441 [Elasticomyces elasticus]KAK4980309.1 hypothetical protein LTR42_000616 [Elasticomyces elasticus]
MADSMLQHILRPIPDLESLPQPKDREERAKIIISNLEQHNQDVRASMLAEAREKLTAMRADEDTNMDDTSDVQNPAVANHSRFVANMNAPHTDGSRDPCLLHGALPDADESITQAPVPTEVRVAQELLQRVDDYDRHARQTRDYYVTALERYQRNRSDPEPVQTNKAHIEAARDPRRRAT